LLFSVLTQSVSPLNALPFRFAFGYSKQCLLHPKFEEDLKSNSKNKAYRHFDKYDAKVHAPYVSVSLLNTSADILFYKQKNSRKKRSEIVINGFILIHFIIVQFCAFVSTL
jgi:hypothetical protein